MTESLERRVAAEIRAELARQGMSGRDLAARTGQPARTVARWLRGPQSPGLDELDAICRALGMDVDDLLDAVRRNGGYQRTPLADSADVPVGVGVRHQGLEPRTRWFRVTRPRRSVLAAVHGRPALVRAA